MSKSMEMFLEMQKIQLIEGDVWGHRKDINEYYTVPSSVMNKIRNMKVDGIPNDKIAEKMSKESKLNQKMILYILNKNLLSYKRNFQDFSNIECPEASLLYTVQLYFSLKTRASFSSCFRLCFFGTITFIQLLLSDVFLIYADHSSSPLKYLS